MNEQKGRLSVLTSLVFVTIALYFFFSSTTTTSSDPGWSTEELDAGVTPTINLDLGHGPVTHPFVENPNSATIKLHPEEHISRLPQTLEIDWNISKAVLRPDGVAKEVFLVNGAFPPSVIECRSGDRLNVVVRNQVQDPEGVAIHWHGLRVENFGDGVAGVTQCAIQPGQEFTYRLEISDPGSFWWYSHFEGQRCDGFFGALIVHKPRDGSSSHDIGMAYDAENLLMVGDWYHRSAKDVLAEYDDLRDFKVEPAPDSLLINGKGFFACAMAVSDQPVDCEEPKIPYLSMPDRRTRVRIVNTGSLTGISIAMSGYTMTIIEIDAGHTVSAITANGLGILYPGERVDVIVERLEHYTSAWITISLDRETLRFPNLALTAEQQFPIAVATPSMGHPFTNLEPRAESRNWIDLATINSSTKLTEELPEMADQVISLHTTISYLEQYEYRPKAFINHTSWSPSSSAKMPLLALDSASWPRDPSPLTVAVQQGQWIDLVISNLDDTGHPFHLHGHSFYVLEVHRSSGVGAFEENDAYELVSKGHFNLANPVKKDTVNVPSGGYVVLRFQAENVGLWLLHCSVLWHAAVGMNMLVEVKDAADDVRWKFLKDNAVAQCRAQSMTSGSEE